jgi:hypothetical protein
VRLQPLFRITLQLRLSGRGHAVGMQVRPAVPLRGRVHEESVGVFCADRRRGGRVLPRLRLPRLPKPGDVYAFFVRAPASASDT